MLKKWIPRLKWLVIPVALVVAYPFRYDIMDALRATIGWSPPADPRPEGVSDLAWCEQNYSEEIAAVAADLDLPYAYLMALIVLECSGNKPAGHRFEKHIKKSLTQLREGALTKFEDLRTRDLGDASDDALTNLATSWGPFQLMGYKALGLGASINELRNEESASRLGALWIKKEYGHFLKKKKWKDAFHYHNTGNRYPLSGGPRTHNPYYVSNGLRYMKYFEANGPSKKATVKSKN